MKYPVMGMAGREDIIVRDHRVGGRRATLGETDSGV